MPEFTDKPFCVRGGEVIGNVPTIEELASYIKEYILNDVYSSEWGTDVVKGATRQAIYNIIQTVVGQLEYKGLWDASSGIYPSNPELGWYYVVSVSGVVDDVLFEIGDWIIWNGTSWDKLTGKSDVMPIGATLMYDGLGIADVETRETQIGDEVGDTIKMAGWYVCNGLAGTPNLLSSFVRGGIASGNVGGSDDAVVVEHLHDVETRFGTSYKAYTVGGTIGISTTYGATDLTGVSGVGKNIPNYYSVIYIIKKG